MRDSFVCAALRGRRSDVSLTQRNSFPPGVRIGTTANICTFRAPRGDHDVKKLC